MSQRRPPTREARAEQLLTALRGSGPPQIDLERLRTRIEARVHSQDVPPFTHQVLPSSSLKVMWLSTRSKALLLSAIALGFVGWGVMHRPSAQESSARVTPIVVLDATARTPMVTQLREPSVRSAQGSEPLQSAGAEPPNVTVAQRANAHTASDAPARTQTVPRAPALRKSASKPPLAPPTAVDAVDDNVTRAAEAEPTHEDTNVGLQQLAPHDPRDLEEMRRVADAEQLLRSAPDETLRLVREDNRRFRDGYFREERRYLEIMALVAMGRREDAELLARLFLKDYARGTYRARVKQALDLP